MFRTTLRQLARTLGRIKASQAAAAVAGGGSGGGGEAGEATGGSRAGSVKQQSEYRGG